MPLDLWNCVETHAFLLSAIATLTLTFTFYGHESTCEYKLLSALYNYIQINIFKLS